MSNYEEDEETTNLENPSEVIVDDAEDQTDPYFYSDNDLSDFTFEEDVSLENNEDDAESY